MARRQFKTIAGYLKVPNRGLDRLPTPKRAVAAACPIRLDSRDVAVFQGFGVQPCGIPVPAAVERVVVRVERDGVSTRTGRNGGRGGEGGGRQEDARCCPYR